jgi:hypothetical protein
LQGINLNKTKLDQEAVTKLVVLFSIMSPAGCMIGMLFSGLSKVLEAIFLAISAGKV